MWADFRRVPVVAAVSLRRDVILNNEMRLDGVFFDSKPYVCLCLFPLLTLCVL